MCRIACQALAALVLLAASASGFARGTLSATFVPTDDNTIVETLPASTRMLRMLRNEETARPDDLELALRSARRLIDISRRDGDPRFLGYAQAALGQWWDKDEPRVVLLRATIRQSRHEFAAALSDLRGLSARTPGDPQVWLTLASVEQVVGNFSQAKNACNRLAALSAGLVGEVCSGELKSLTGDHAVYPALRQRFDQDTTLDAGTRSWLATVLAEMAWREGADADAQELFMLAMKQSPSLYLRGAYADFLLDNQRAADALVVSHWPDPAWNTWPDALLLRHVLALAALKRNSELEVPRQEQQQRFEAARRRGDAQHGREEARFALVIDGDASRALQLAQENWTHQKEPADALILAQAAVAAHREDVLQELRRFVQDVGFSDRRLRLVLDTGKPGR